MNCKGDKLLIVGLDIGIFKVVVLVGEYLLGNLIEVIGIGLYELCGLKCGVVVDIELIVQLIQCVVEEVELMVGCEICLVYVLIFGNYVQCKNLLGIVLICDGEVIWGDLDCVFDVVKVVVILVDQKILYVILCEYVLDDLQEGICNLVGMIGVCLEVYVYLVVCVQLVVVNISKCVQCCGLQVDDLVLFLLVFSVVVLIVDECELGVVLVDMGVGIIDIVVFVQGVICYIVLLLIVGDYVINDIVYMLCMLILEVEQIKVCYVCVLVQLVMVEESIQVLLVGDCLLCCMLCYLLVQVVQGCYEEIFEMVQVELCCFGFEELVCVGMVLIGGVLKMEGVVELVEEMLQMLVCVGILQYVIGLGEVVGNLVYVIGVGLLLMGSQIEYSWWLLLLIGCVGSVFKKFKIWFRGEF